MTTTVNQAAPGAEQLPIGGFRTGRAPTAAATAAQEMRKVIPMQGSAVLDNQVHRSGATIPCREYDAELWFAESPTDVEFAKALCLGCPAMAACLAGALERQEPWGVWGGQLFVQGVVVPRKRPRGRPRKSDVAA